MRAGRVRGRRDDREGENGRGRRSGRSCLGTIDRRRPTHAPRFSSEHHAREPWRRGPRPGSPTRGTSRCSPSSSGTGATRRSGRCSARRWTACSAGRDSLVVLPTGGGKSLCFQAPALVRPGLAIVVSPLISLMKDQVDTLVGNGVAAACFNSSMPSDQKSAVMAGVREGRYRLLYVSPERLVGDGGEGFISRLASAGAPVQLRRHRRGALHQPVGPRLPPRVPAARTPARAAARRQPARLHRHRHRPRAAGHRQPARAARRRGAGRLVRSAEPRLPRAAARQPEEADPRRHGPPSRRGRHRLLHRRARKSTALAEWLRQEGVRALAYHAGLSDDERHRNQDAFLDERADVVVATVAFGMGIDRSNVRFVIHAGAPKSLEHYQQEAGRAGRDGLEAECVLIVSAADFLKWRMMLERSGEMTDARRALLRDMERYAACGRLPPQAPGRLLRRALRQGRLRRLRLLPGRARAGAGRRDPGPQDPLVRGAGGAALRRGARHQRAAWQRHRAGADAASTTS